MSGADDYGDEFTHCQYCGVPSASHTDEAGDLIGSAFARGSTTVERSRWHDEEKESSAAEEIGHSEEIKLKPCTRYAKIRTPTCDLQLLASC